MALAETRYFAVDDPDKTGDFAVFQQDGVLRDAVYRDGRFHSLVLMSILESEYAASRSSSPRQ